MAERTPPTVFVDADACPVKSEVYRVTARHGVPVKVVANTWMRTPLDARIELVVVQGDLDAADDWIAERVAAHDVVVTADIPLAGRCLEKHAFVLGPTGRAFHDDMIGDALATRELLSQMREAGVATGGPPPFGKQDRSRFLQRLEEMVRRAVRARGV
ncbi:MAG: YaiI/YqxD family protein [Acidobacteriota bacterium]